MGMVVLMRTATLISYAVVAGVLLAGCLSAKVAPVYLPTPPAPGWTIFSSIEIGVALALPPHWATLDAKASPEAAVAAVGVQDPAAAGPLAQLLASLRTSGAVYAAVDTSALTQRTFTTAWVARVAAPAEGLDAYIARLPPPTSTPDLDIRLLTQSKLAIAGGPSYTRRLRQEGIFQGIRRVVIQYQYLAVARESLFVLFVDVPGERDDQLAAQTKLIGESLRTL